MTRVEMVHSLQSFMNETRVAIFGGAGRNRTFYQVVMSRLL